MQVNDVLADGTVRVYGREDMGMIDQYGRTIDYMRISITDRCNLRCRYCMPDGIQPVPKEEILTYEEIIQVCRAAAREGITKLKITGGEPLVRPGCPELIGRLKKIPGIRQVTLTTNGILLHRYLPKLQELGLDAVNISLDTRDPKRYQAITGQDGLPAVMESIYQAVDAGFPVKINCVLLKGLNDSEWPQMAAFAQELSVAVRFIEMMPIGYGKQYETIPNPILLEKLKTIYPGLEQDGRVHGNGPAEYYTIPGAPGSIGMISAIHGKFCKNCNRLRLTSRGKLKPCLCYAQTMDLLQLLRKPGQAFPKKEAQIRCALRQAIWMKPQYHRFEESSEVTEEGQMVQIGG